jgi:very-short-patch-repair endonuclease
MGLRVVRFTNDDVMKNLSGVMDYLAAVIEEMQTSP